MRIALYDGILEQHVADSLERALLSRGHDVYSTGKITGGFQFKTGQSQLRDLEIEISDVIAFAPDWVFVFRPAALPYVLLDRLQRRGIRVAAWFSDDPVLFDLSYAPLLERYDLVLHCADERVLRFYEEQFGYPTGVNVPFWTDHEAFPRVWGYREPSSDVMFLGNVDDEIRRHRYFDLASLGADVTIYGRVGDDPHGLGGGYLDSDADVVDAGSRTRMAINIPQFFENHRGLRTWFPELGSLGFFEYPSRVVQYMAMGIPVATVVPGRPDFAAVPEMLVYADFEEASGGIRAAVEEADLTEISNRTAARFDRHFTAVSRVLMLEHLFESADWKTLDARERSLYFTRFESGQAEAVEPGQRIRVVSSSVEGGGLAIDEATASASIPLNDLVELRTNALELTLVRNGALTRACDAAVLSVILDGKSVWESPLGVLPDRLVITWTRQDHPERVHLRLAASEPLPLNGRERCSVRMTATPKPYGVIGAPPGVWVGSPSS